MKSWTRIFFTLVIIVLRINAGIIEEFRIHRQIRKAIIMNLGLESSKVNIRITSAQTELLGEWLISGEFRGKEVVAPANHGDLLHHVPINFALKVKNLKLVETSNPRFPFQIKPDGSTRLEGVLEVAKTGLTSVLNNLLVHERSLKRKSLKLEGNELVFQGLAGSRLGGVSVRIRSKVKVQPGQVSLEFIEEDVKAWDLVK